MWNWMKKVRQFTSYSQADSAKKPKRKPVVGFWLSGMARKLRIFFSRVWYRKVYLHSKHWRDFREVAWVGYRKTCYICGKKIRRIEGMNVHHLRYFRDGKSILGKETLSDVRIVHRGYCHREADRRRKAGA